MKSSTFQIEIVKPFQIPEENITTNELLSHSIGAEISIQELIDNGSVGIIYDPNYLNTSIFCNKDGELIHYFNHEGNWENLSLGKCSGDISVIKHKNEIYLFYVDHKCQLNFQKKTQQGWSLHKKSFEKYKVKGRISAVYENQRSHPAIFFKDQNGSIHYFYYENEWKLDYKTFEKYPCVGDLTAIYEENRSHSGIFYHGKGDKIYHWTVINGAWTVDSNSFKKTKVGGALSAIYNSNRYNSELFVVSDDHSLHYYSHDVNWKLGHYLFYVPVSGDMKACYNPISGSPEVIFTSKSGFLQHYTCGIDNVWSAVSYFENKPNSPIGITFSDHRKSIEFFYLSYDQSGHYYYNSGLKYIHETSSFSDNFNQLRSNNNQVRNFQKMKIQVNIICAYNLPKSKNGSYPDSACEVTIEDQTDTTKTITSDLNPLWSEIFQFEIKKTTSPLKLTVFDTSDFVSKDLGSININLDDLEIGLNSLLLQLPDQGTLSVEIKTEGFGKTTEKPLISNTSTNVEKTTKEPEPIDVYSGVIEEPIQKQKEYQSSSKILPFLFSHGSVDIFYEQSRNHVAVVSTIKGKLTYYFYGDDNVVVKDNISLPECNGDLSVVWENQRNHIGIFYEGKNGLLRYSYWDNGKWAHSGENAFKASGAIGGRICAIYEPQRKHSACFFVGTDNRIHYWYLRDGAWAHDYGSFGIQCHGDISVVYENHRNHSAIFYESPDNQLVYYYVEKVWKYETKKFEQFKVGGAISAVYNERRKHSEVFFSNRNAKLNYCYNLNGVWTVDHFSFKEPVLGDLKAIYNPSNENCEVVYSTVSGISHYFVKDNEWQNLLHSSSNAKGTIAACYSPIRRRIEFYYLSSSHVGHYHHYNGYTFQHDDKTYN